MGNPDPLGGRQITVGDGSQLSATTGAKVTAVPAGLVVTRVTMGGQVMVGGAQSCTASVATWLVITRAALSTCAAPKNQILISLSKMRGIVRLGFRVLAEDFFRALLGAVARRGRQTG